MMRTPGFLFYLFIASVSYGQAEIVLNKGGCGSKAIRNRYASKAQIAGSEQDGKIIAASNLLLTRQEVTAFTFMMEPGQQYDVNLIIDGTIKNKLAPHPETWGSVLINGKVLAKLSKQVGTDIFYALPIADKKQQVEIKIMGSNYYDLRDAVMPEDVCAIIYAVRRKNEEIPEVKPVQKANEPTTVVPAAKPDNKKIFFTDWEQAKQKLSWQWLETPATDRNAYRYFSNNSLMVLQKTANYSWAQTLLTSSPFPAYWNYTGTFNFVKGKADDAALGLMLPGRKNGEDIKMMFLVNPLKQTWFFGYYNVDSKKWFSMVTGVTKPTFTTVINKYDPAYQFVANILSISREGKEVKLYVNHTLVQTIKVSGNVALNKINGIGITARGEQGYYVTDPGFWILE